MRRIDYFYIVIAIIIVVLQGLMFHFLIQNFGSTTELKVKNATQAERIFWLEQNLNECRENNTPMVSGNTFQTAPAAIEIVTETAKVNRVNTGNTKKGRVNTTPPAPSAAEPVIHIITEGSNQSAPAASGTRQLSQASTQTFPAHFYEPGTKGVKFCIRLGGDEKRHLPHLAIASGGIKAEANGISGFNWVLDGPVADLVGDWGITPDGTFFVSEKLVNAHLSASDNGVVEIKAPATNWQAMKMTRFDGYYIYKAK